MGLETPNSEKPDPIDITIENETVRIAPQGDGTFTVYIDTCMFSVEQIGDQLEIEDITPEDRQGRWRALSLKPVALQALKEAGLV